MPKGWIFVLSLPIWILKPIPLYGDETSSTGVGTSYHIEYLRHRDISHILQSLHLQPFSASGATAWFTTTLKGDRNTTLSRLQRTGSALLATRFEFTPQFHLEIESSAERTYDEGNDYFNKTAQSRSHAVLTYRPFDYLVLTHSASLLNDHYGRQSTTLDTTLTNIGWSDSLAICISRTAGEIAYRSFYEHRTLTGDDRKVLDGQAHFSLSSSSKIEMSGNAEHRRQRYPGGNGPEEKQFTSGSGKGRFQWTPHPGTVFVLASELERDCSSYREESHRDRTVERGRILSDISFRPLPKSDVTISMSRGAEVRDFQQDASDETLTDLGFTGTIRYTLSQTILVAFERSLWLQSRTHPLGDSLDRDHFIGRTALHTSLGLGPQAHTTLSLKVDDNHLVYVGSYFSSNTRRTVSYVLSDETDWYVLPGVKVRPSGSIRADYTTYRFTGHLNRLVRSASGGTEIDWKRTSSLEYRLGYQFNHQSQGPYMGTGAGRGSYHKESETIRHTLEGRVGWMVTSGLSIEPSYQLRRTVRSAYLMDPSSDTLIWETVHDQREYTIALSVQGRIGAQSQLSLRTSRTDRDEEEPFWDMTASVEVGI